jgi:hypothetical protein
VKLGFYSSRKKGGEKVKDKPYYPENCTVASKTALEFLKTCPEKSYVDVTIVHSTVYYDKKDDDGNIVTGADGKPERIGRTVIEIITAEPHVFAEQSDESMGGDESMAENCA